MYETPGTTRTAHTQVSFGRGEHNWSNWRATPLLGVLAADIARFGRVLKARPQALLAPTFLSLFLSFFSRATPLLGVLAADIARFGRVLKARAASASLLAPNFPLSFFARSPLVDSELPPASRH